MYFGLSGLLYSVVLLPSCFDPKTEVSRKSSIPTAILLVVSAVVWSTLGMPLSAILSAVAVLPWAWLAYRRPIRAAKEVVTAFPELPILAPGCSSCPSQSELGDSSL